MARTKQTARCCLVRRANVNSNSNQFRSIKSSGQGNKYGFGSILQSSNKQQQIVNNQQFSIKFDDQAKCEAQSTTGQIINCRNCQAILTVQSKIYQQKQYHNLKNKKSLNDQQKQKFLKMTDRVWICQFCLTHNNIQKNYKMPTQQNPCFLIQKSKKRTNHKNKIKQQDEQNQMLIFCIDISKSMQIQVALNKSRLDILKQAIIEQIDRLKMQKQSLKVGIVLFGSSVILFGDASKKQTQVDINLYNNYDAIIKQAEKIQNFCRPLCKSYKKLRSKILDLSYLGSTALGPALLTSIQIASTGGIGSKVIICTDGEANVGVGSCFFNFGFPQQNNDNFYSKAAQFAKLKGVSVSCLSLKGDKCNLKQISKLSLATNGSLLKIDPKNLGTQFSKITKQQIIGTESNIKIKVNKIFQIISDNISQISVDKTTLTRNAGNFSSDTELTFQFNVLNKQQAQKNKNIDLDMFKQDKVPMQIQLQYLGRNGNRYMQIITDWRNLTQNQKQIYQGANYQLFSTSVLQRASNKIKSSQFKQAENIIKGYWSLVSQKFSKQQSKSNIKKINDQIKQLQKVLQSKINKQKKKGTLGIKPKNQIIKAKSKSKVSNSRQRSRDKKAKRSTIQSQQEQQSNNQVLSSDEEQQILCKYMRARS